MKIRQFLVIAAVVCFACNKTEVNSTTNPTTSGFRIYGSGKGQILTSFEKTTDGGYLYGGTTGFYPAQNGFVQKTDSSGNILWTYNYGGAQVDNFYAVHATSDGGCIAAGSTSSFGNGLVRQDFFSDAYLVKIDANGNIAWQKTFGKLYNDFFNDVTETPDHEFVATGVIIEGAGSSTEYQVLAVKVDKDGKLLFNRQYLPGRYSVSGVSVTCQPNGNIAIGAEVVISKASIYQGTFYPALVHLASNGKQLDTVTYENMGTFNVYLSKWAALVVPEPVKIISVSDGFILTANRNDVNTSIVLFKTDLKGNIIWQKEYFGLGKATCYNIKSNGNGGTLISGVTFDASGKSNCMLLNTGPDGNKLWENHIPVNGFDTWTVDVVPYGNNWALGLNLLSNINTRAVNFALIHSDQNGKIIDNKK